LHEIEEAEIEASKRLEAINQKLPAKDNAGSGDISPKDLEGVESKLLNAVNEVDQILGDARQLNDDLALLNVDPGNEEYTMWKVLESLDIILFKTQSEKLEAPFVICPECNRKVDAREDLSIKKKKGAILFTCSLCDAKTRFSLSSLVENMVGANTSTEARASKK
jgi:hypothetical protein